MGSVATARTSLVCRHYKALSKEALDAVSNALLRCPGSRGAKAALVIIGGVLLSASLLDAALLSAGTRIFFCFPVQSFTHHSLFLECY